jgi:hypothetical protein
MQHNQINQYPRKSLILFLDVGDMRNGAVKKTFEFLPVQQMSLCYH